MEFLVWTELIQQSHGALHVFLPLLDRGLDAVIHRMTDGEYIPLQVKSRSQAVNGFVEIGIPESMLVEDRALIVAGLLKDDNLGPFLLVVDEGTFKERASRSLVKGVPVYSASFSMTSTTSHWRPYLVPREQLAERLLGSPPAVPTFELPEELEIPVDRYARWLGFLGEAETVRRLAQDPNLDLFRPFPDLEMVEVLVRNHNNGRFVGIQVKTGVPSEPYGEANITIRKATFVPAPSTLVLVLAWLPEEQRFSDECLLVPTTKLISVAVDQDADWALNFHPHSQDRTRLDPYRQPLSSLGQLAEG